MLTNFFEIDAEQAELDNTLSIIRQEELELEAPKKGLSPFDFINNIYKKVKWDSYTDAEQKSFNVFIINKALSMNLEFTDIISQLQYLTYVMPNSAIYRMYCDILSKPKSFAPFIKSKKSETYNEQLISILQNHFKISQREIYLYLDILSENEIISILKMYGINDKDIKKLTKVSK